MKNKLVNMLNKNYLKLQNDVSFFSCSTPSRPEHDLVANLHGVAATLFIIYLFLCSCSFLFGLYNHEGFIDYFCF